MTEWTRETADTSRERSIVIAMVMDKEVLKDVGEDGSRLLDIDYMKTVAKWCLTHFEKYGKAPKENIQTIYDAHSRNGLDPDQAALIHNFLSSISEEYEGTGNADFHIDRAKQFFQERRQQVHLERLEEHKRNGNLAGFDDENKRYLAEQQSEQGRDFKTALEESVMPFHEFARIEIPTPEFIVGTWLRESSINLIAAPPGVGKTWLGLEAAAGAANGRDCMAGLWRVDRDCPTLYVEGEMHPSDLQTRGAMVGFPAPGQGRISLKGGNLDGGLRNSYMLSTLWFESQYGLPFNLYEEETRQILFNFLVSKGIRLLFLDNIYSLIVGDDPNLSKDWSPINQWLLRLRGKNVATILDHHTGHDLSRQTGAKAKENNVDLYLVLKDARTPEEIEGDRCAFSIKIHKQRHKGAGQLAGKKYICEDGRWTVTGLKNKDETDRKVAEMLVDGKNYKDIAAAIGKSAGAITPIRNRLLDKGHIKDIGEGKHKGAEWTEKGREWFDKGDGEYDD